MESQLCPVPRGARGPCYAVRMLSLRLAAPCLVLCALLPAQGAPGLVRDLEPGPQSAPSDSIPYAMVSVGAFALFSASEGSIGRELWRTDGTAAGTMLVRDILLGPAPSDAEPKVALGAGVALLVADDGVHGKELWRSDGTRNGTTLVKDIAPGALGSDPGPEFVVAGGSVYFTADDGATGREL